MPEVPQTSSAYVDVNMSPFTEFTKAVKGFVTPQEKVDNPAAAKKAPTIIDKGSFKSFADMQQKGFGTDQKMAQFAAARQLKDPHQAPTPQLKMQALSGKLQRIYSSPEYQGMQPENRTRAKSYLYDKYVAPILKENGIEPPEKADWIKGYGHQAEETQPHSTREGIFDSALISSQADMTRLVGNVLKFGMSHGDPRAVGNKTDVPNQILEFADKLQKVSTDYNSTFDAPHGTADWLANFSGSMLGDAPAYIGAGKLVQGVGELVPSLAERSAISPGFKVALHSLKAAGEVVAVNKAEGKGLVPSLEAGLGTFLLGGALGSAALKFKSAQLAIGGEPFANKIAADADLIKEGHNPLEQRSLVNPNDPDYRQAVNNEKFLREHFAKEFYPDKAETAGDKSIWRNLSTGQRTKIKDHISAITKQAAELMPIVNPEVQTMANTKEISKAAIENPRFAQRLQEMEKLTGLKGGEILTKVQADKVGQETGLTSKAAQLTEVFGSQDMFGENPRGFKGVKSLGNKALSNMLLPESAFIEGTTKYLEDNPATKSGKDYFENPQHHLLWVANYSDAPEAVKKTAFDRLRRDYNMSREEAGNTRAGGWLANFRQDLARTGHLHTEGNIYRSTKLSAPRYGTSFQKEVTHDELPQEQIDQLKKLVRLHPEMKKTVEGLVQQLTAIGNKSNTPLTLKLRRATQDQIVELLKGLK